jgi:hypothetical protein
MLSPKQAKRMVTKARRRHRKASGRARLETSIALTKAYDRLFKARHPTPAPSPWYVPEPDPLADLEWFVRSLYGKRLDTTYATSTP